MKFVLFYHSLISDWNHGNAHFLRGIVTELLVRGHDVVVYEPANSWSAENLLAEHGQQAIEDFHLAYPSLHSRRYDPASMDLNEALDKADLVIVHEWSDHDLVRRIGNHRAHSQKYRLLFHDTHHRAITDRESMAAYDLSHYDGVLAYGAVLRDLYLAESWIQRAWTWHEAADTKVFHPLPNIPRTRDLVWIGNWGDDERTAELHEFLIRPVQSLGLDTEVFGVRYPDEAKTALTNAGIEYGGWLANFRAPAVFAQFRMTVHVPRRPYVEALPGIPTIRPFEALACGIPLISAPWNDVEGLFEPGRDFLIAKNGAEMQRHIRALLADKAMARELAEHGLQAILRRHTCVHRVDELLGIYEVL
ncbi:MAG: glycosyltransferase [Verrucomicrobiaceae bacterium]|nr:MAG: glycosyltransferase [Verrucomicrobiaceae bacterium]